MWTNISNHRESRKHTYFYHLNEKWCKEFIIIEPWSSENMRSDMSLPAMNTLRCKDYNKFHRVNLQSNFSSVVFDMHKEVVCVYVCVSVHICAFTWVLKHAK